MVVEKVVVVAEVVKVSLVGAMPYIVARHTGIVREANIDVDIRQPQQNPAKLPPNGMSKRIEPRVSQTRAAS